MLKENGYYNERLFIVLDTEDTGISKIPVSSYKKPLSILRRGSEVIQIGGIVLNEKQEPIKLFCHYCDTVIADSPEEALSVHGISQKVSREYVRCQFLPEIITAHLPELLFPNVCFIGYNVEFDMQMIGQSISNSPIDWKYKPVMGNILPKTGRYSVDVMQYLFSGNRRKRLSSFNDELRTKRDKFISIYGDKLSVQTNCIEMLSESWKRSHNSFFDALNTYILWGERVWKKKLL